MLDTQLNHYLTEVNFPVAVQDIDGVPNDQYRKIVRTDTDTFLGMCKTRYKPITHTDAFGGAIKSMINGGIDFKDAQIDVKSYQYGAMAKMEIVFPNYKEQIGNHDLNLNHSLNHKLNLNLIFILTIIKILIMIIT